MRKTASIVLAVCLTVLATASRPSEAADKALTATGTIRTVQASSRTVVVALSDGGEARFSWNDDTKITGVLAPGAKITVRYVPGSGGENVALQITVPRS
jgi:ABC-type amino acid transport substrate-binding protein